ncbi:MAG TPA: glycosyltransferase [Candidatus Omnitrophota bacterium]|nr:glycosyltransferase [Candidatus Omnitrophota bacterium]HPN87897.1 glycosyltransferase [Candidatus Omnitrophota bacterium]
MNVTPITIIIPVFNSEKTIAKTLEAVLNQSYPNVEIIVVDDGSTDSTAKIIEMFIEISRADNKKVISVYQNNAGPASARNRGAKEANTEIIFFTDSDCVPHQNWIEQSLDAFKDKSVAVVAGSYGIANAEFLLARCVYQEILYRHKYLMPQYPKSFGSYNFGIRKKIFEEVGGFNQNYRYASGEDNDLSYKILKAGYKIYFEKKSLVDHYHPTQLKKYLKEQFRHGFWRFKMYQDHPAMIKGDDYTFGKDIIEIPWAGFILMSLFLSLFGFIPIEIFLWLSIFLLMMEIYYAIFMAQENQERFYLGFVMFLRSFARMLGFVKGGLYYLNNIIINI